MHELTKFNYLTIDHSYLLPIPDRVKKACPRIIWDGMEWDTLGLPLEGAKYSLLNGDILYQDVLPNGEVKVERSTYTGEVILSSCVANEDTHFFLMFKAVFFNGDLIGIVHEESNERPLEDFAEASKRLTEQIKKNIALRKNFAFRYIYQPYRFIIRVLAFSINFILLSIRYIITKLALFLTPL